MKKIVLILLLIGLAVSTSKSLNQPYNEDSQNLSYLYDKTETKNVKCGSVSISGTGDLSVTGLGFRPIRVDFSISHEIISGSYIGIGCMVKGGTQNATVASNQDGGGGRASRVTDGCVLLVNMAGDVETKASFVSMDKDGFTINVSVYTAARTLSYTASD